MLQGIARALRLSDQERTHLFSLAGELEHVPGRLPSREVAPSTAALLDRLADTPALLVDNTCQVLAWNPLAAALFEDFSALRAADRNILRRIFQVFQHPQVGPIELDFDILTVPDLDQQVVIFTAEPGSDSYQNLQLLKVIGTQRMDVPT